MSLTARDGTSRAATIRSLADALVGGSGSGLHERAASVHSTRRTVNALPDLQYQQVIDNLAKIAANPGVPSLSRGRRAGLGAGDRQW